MAGNKKYTFIGLKDPWTGASALNGDPFRKAVGSVWQTPFKGASDPYYLENQILFGKKVDPQPLSIEFGPIINSAGKFAPYNAKHQVVKLTANPKVFGGKDCCDENGLTWKQYIRELLSNCNWAKGMNPRQALAYLLSYREGNTTTTITADMGDAGQATSVQELTPPHTYHDCVFDHDVPFSKQELNLLGAAKSTVYGEVDFEYDFYLEAYETALKNTKLPEISLPNLYLTANKDGRPGLLIFLKDNIPCRAKEFVKMIGAHPYKVLMVPIENAEQINTLNAHKETFPMRTEISFSTDTSTYVADALKKSKLAASLMRRATEFVRDSTYPFGIGQEYVIKSKGKTKRKFFATKAQLYAYDLLNWADFDSQGLDVKGNPIDPALPPLHTFIGPAVPSTDVALSSASPNYEKVMGHMILSGQLKTVMKNYNRSFHQVLLGNKAHSETVMYRIVKFPQLDPDTIEIDDMDDDNVWEKDGDLVGIKSDCTWRMKRGCEALDLIDAAIKAQKTAPLQEFWVANSSDLDIFKYVDTQVKYDKGYTYVVYAYRLVIGTDYFYSLTRENEETGQNPGLQLGDIGTIWKMSNEGKEEETICDKYNKLRVVIDELGLDDAENDALAAYLALPENEGKTVQQIFDALIASGVSYSDALGTMTSDLDQTLSDLADKYGAGFEAFFELDGANVVVVIEALWLAESLVESECNPDDWEAWSYTLKAGEANNKWDLEFSTVCECPEVDPESCGEAGLIVTTIPSTMIYEVPYFAYDGRIMDSMPIFPGVDIIPYRNVNNKLLFNLTTNIGEYELNPIIINPKEEKAVFEAMKSQGLVCGEKLHYESDDPATFFEIYRTTKRPKTYFDFAGHRRKLLPTDFDPASIQKGDSADYIDKIIPNKKYYYTFRTIDIHGHFSNPSPVYEVELVDADGAVYPLIRIIPLCPEPKKIISKPAKKLLQIVPRITQAVVNEEKSGLPETLSDSALPAKGKVSLGVERESVWGKTFKLRLTSKKTCRKMDINLNFDVEFVDNQKPCFEPVATPAASSELGTPATISIKKT